MNYPSCELNGEFRYGLKFRPAGLGSVPKGYTRTEAAATTEASIARHGIIIYSEALSVHDILSFELVVMSTDDSFVAKAVAVGLGEYGMRYAEFLLSDDKQEVQIATQAFRDAIGRCFKVHIHLEDDAEFNNTVVTEIKYQLVD